MIGTIRFWLRNDKKLKNGKCPIHLIYSVAGNRTVFNTKLSCIEQNWDEGAKRFKAISKAIQEQVIDKSLILNKTEVQDLNNDISILIGEILNIEKYLSSQSISSKVVIEKLKELHNPLIVKSEPKDKIYDFIDKYIDDHVDVRVSGSLVVYRSLANHLKDFELVRKKRVTFEEIDYGFFQSFQAYLLKKTRYVAGEAKLLGENTIAKQLNTLKTFLSYARLEGITLDRSYQDFKVKKVEKDVIALTQEEFDLIYEYDLSENSRLDKVRDLFLFSISTGLRWSDMENLQWHNIKGVEILITVQKTNASQSIPLNKISANVLQKYKDLNSLKPLPIIASQNFNKYIKELCELVGIDSPVEIVCRRGDKRIVEVKPKYELISAHTGRKAFVTLSLAKGMAAEVIMNITGHKDYKSFKRYVAIGQKTKKDSIIKAWGEPEMNLNLKVV